MSLIGDGIEIMNLIDKAKNAELFKQLGEWIDKVLVLQRRNDELTTECNALKEQLRFKGLIERINGHVFLEGDDEEICPRCAEADRKLIHLLRTPSKRLPGVKAGCPACKLEMNHNIPYSRALASRENLFPGIG